MSNQIQSIISGYFTGGLRGSVNKFGRNSDVDAPEDIWDGGGDWVAPTAARVFTVASSSDSDGKTAAPSSVGARTVRIYGLQSWDEAETSEDITLDGTTGVLTVASYVIVHRIKVLTAGTSGPNVGAITATPATSGSASTIIAGAGQTLMAIYGIPSIKTAFITQYYFALNRATAGSFNGILLVNPEPDQNAATFLTKHVIGSSSNITHQFRAPLKVDGPAIIKCRADPTSVNYDISAGFDLVLK